MTPRIETLPEKKLVGKHLTMSLSNNKTRELWQQFQTSRTQIENSKSSLLYSVQQYDPAYFRQFNPTNNFEKWAAMEVTDFDHVPEGFERLVLPGGLYAVFLHRGAAQTAPKTFQHIFSVWLPQSEYTLDHRPHFEILGEKYKNDHPDSEEEIWIPVLKK